MALTKVTRGVLGVCLLFCSNAFMNTAWYLHLKFENWNMAQAIFISWSIALPEYSLQVPANRLAHTDQGGPFTAPQLKVIAEVCSLTTFAIFSTLVLKEKLRWVDLGAFALILSGVLLSLLTKPAAKPIPVVIPPVAEPPGAATNGTAQFIKQTTDDIKNSNGTSTSTDATVSMGKRRLRKLKFISGDDGDDDGVRVDENTKPKDGQSPKIQRIDTSDTTARSTNMMMNDGFHDSSQSLNRKESSSVSLSSPNQ